MGVAENIEHTGRVVRTEEGKIFVVITAGSACGSCRARKACGMGEQSEKIIEVESASWSEYAEGEEVIVAVRKHVGMRAVLLAYALPVVIMLALLVAAKVCGTSDGVAAGVCVAGAAVYYALLFVLRRRVAEGIKFTIHKI